MLALLKAELPAAIALFVTGVLVPLGEQIGFPLTNAQQERIEGWINLAILLLATAVTKHIHTRIKAAKSIPTTPAQPASTSGVKK